ncbi:hypothetical protein GOP47_0015540 [Adiantum capillus-veneris]|uniref:Vacuolar protein sorting-associated protein 62 n=1 Tax=Adiantum capillus-veneris TaxID=13818 RepID=A0A9D4UKJ5_ADICA|nr:hypothetical protein GOP47_0015540 [Adiantum capillus-veneris]
MACSSIERLGWLCSLCRCFLLLLLCLPLNSAAVSFIRANNGIAQSADIATSGPGTLSCGVESGTNGDASVPCLKSALAFSLTGIPYVGQLDSRSSSSGSIDSGTEDAASEPHLQNSSLALSGVPSVEQIKSLISTYGPIIYFHPKEQYFPASVDWFFGKGALLYSKGQSAPTVIARDGSNLPAGGSDDGEYWIDFPNDGTAGEVRIGSLQTAKVYAHAKQMFGVFTDIALWIFYPFNGAARARFEIIDLDLGKIGEHVSDWEHVTLRIDNLTGKLSRVFFSQHSGGVWVDPIDLEYADGSKFVVYASRSGHASYPHPGIHLLGDHGVGLRNDADKSQYILDASRNFKIVSADYLGFGNAPEEPAWLQFMRKWGPKLDYEAKEEIDKAIQTAPFFLRHKLRSLANKLPNEVMGEEGPTGPKEKASWTKDEQMW